MHLRLSENQRSFFFIWQGHATGLGRHLGLIRLRILNALGIGSNGHLGVKQSQGSTNLRQRNPKDYVTNVSQWPWMTAGDKFQRQSFKLTFKLKVKSVRGCLFYMWNLWEKTNLFVYLHIQRHPQQKRWLLMSRWLWYDRNYYGREMGRIGMVGNWGKQLRVQLQPTGANCWFRLIWGLQHWSRSRRSRYILPGAGAGAGAAEKFYSEPEPEPEPEYFPGAGAGADQKCHGSASLASMPYWRNRCTITEMRADCLYLAGKRCISRFISIDAPRCEEQFEAYLMTSLYDLKWPLKGSHMKSCTNIINNSLIEHDSDSEPFEQAC